LAGSVFPLLSKPLRRAIAERGWPRPTRIQELAIPTILEGTNTLLIAPTGTGKTEAAIFPIFEQLLRARTRTARRGISIVYITPLRALNRDIFRRIIDIGVNLDIAVQVRHGDTPQKTRRLQALKPPDMLITTPETLQAILPGRRMKQHLRSVMWVVVDEIHELVTDKRGVQLSVGLERLRELTGHEFQRIGLSATVGSYDVVAHFLCGKGRPFRVLKSLTAKDFTVWVESLPVTDADRAIADKALITPGSVRRIKRLLELIDEYKSVLVFTNTREHAEALSSRVMALNPEAKVGVHHGSLSRAVRIETEMRLKEGALNAVICTSSLELGLDVGHVEFVIQYMSPRQVVKLVQRIGRSGHVVGATSRGCVIAVWPDDVLEAAVIAKFAQDEVLEVPQLHDNALDVLAHQVVGLVFDWGRLRLDDAHRIVSRAWPFRNLVPEDLRAVVEQLESSGIVRVLDDVVRRRAPRCFEYYYENLSMIPDVKRYAVVDFVRRRSIGTLDQGFIARHGEPGKEFVIHGQTWKILSVDDDEGAVQVEPVYQSLGAVPAWEGEIIPVPFEVAQRVGQLRSTLAEELSGGDGANDALAGYPVRGNAVAKVVDVLQRQIQEGYPIPTDTRILIEGYEIYVTLHACFGNMVNETLAKILASLLSARYSVNVGTQTDPYRIVFIAPVKIDPEVVKRDLVELDPDHLAPILDATLGKTNMLAWRIWNVAKRFGAVRRGAEFKARIGRTLSRVLHGTPVHAEALREVYVEKLDLAKAEEVVRAIRRGRIGIDVVHRPMVYSPLALPILDRIAPQDVLRPSVPVGAILDVVRNRLNSGEVRLICVFKGDYDGIRSVRSLPDKIRCPKCGATLVAAVHPADTTTAALVHKRLARKKLSPSEFKTYQTAWKNAGIVQTYGKKAVMTLRARGVGPTTAVRILHNYFRNEDEFVMAIIRAERNYVRTRMFWDR
jgi:ATP-dependent Lhr-like helicase